MVKAHNAAFERVMWNVVIRRMYPDAPLLLAEQMDCTMARAAAISHPQDLDKLCKAVEAQERKDEEGHALMMKMAKPRNYKPDGTIIWWDEPHNIDRLMRYCDQDIVAECGIDDAIPPLTDYERRVWLFDQKINDRGIFIDIGAANRCVELVSLAKKEADREMRTITQRNAPKCSNDGKLIAWIQSRGIECTTVKKGVQDDLLFLADLKSDTVVRQALELRKAAKKTSTAKYAAALLCVCADSRVRGLLNYHGAGPGRWAGRLLQPQNFPRVDYKREGHIIEWLHDLIQNKNLSTKDIYDAIVLVHGHDAPMRILSRALRSMIKAPPGHKLIGGDFSNIEGRKNAWFAGEAWKLAAFAAYDEGTGPDLYKLAYSKSFNTNVEEVDDDQRQIGKVQELALGYQGSIGAVLTMGDTYGLDPYNLARAVHEVTPASVWDFTAAKYEKARDKSGLQEREWTAIKVVVDGWRAANPAIVQSWWDYQDAAVEAVSSPGTIVSCVAGKVQYYSDGRCLWCVLPSGRMICYAYPSIETDVVEYEDKYGQTRERVRRKVCFWGFKEGQWKKLYLYGGLQCENIVQGSSRCVMVDRMFAVEDAGYPIILTVHDEILAEVKEGIPHLNDKEFEKIMSVVPSWCAGLPLSAKAWEAERYVK
jgi:DNA polymerase